jgi:16S rRNA G1207 methylase RsmC
MCLFHESLTGDDLIYRLFPLAPGVNARLHRGGNLLVVGCGNGEILHYLSDLFPRSLFTGLDSSGWNIACARQYLYQAGRRNVWFESGDLTSRSFGQVFHLVISLTANGPLSADACGALYRSLHEEGTLFLCHDAGPATGRLHDAGFTSVRSVVLPNDALSHVYIARK